MTQISAQQNFSLAGAASVEADLAAGRRAAGLPPLTVEETEIALEAAMAAMENDRTPRNIYEAEICRRARGRALDEHEQATRTGRFAPVGNPL